MFTPIANDLPLSRHSTNYHWTELSKNKLCLVFHTDSNSNANAVVMLQTVEFSDAGDITWGPVRYIKTLGVRSRYTFIKCCAMGEDKIVLATPNESTNAGSTDGVSSTGGVSPTGTRLNLEIVEVETGKLLKSEILFDVTPYGEDSTSYGIACWDFVPSTDRVDLIVYSSSTGSSSTQRYVVIYSVDNQTLESKRQALSYTDSSSSNVIRYFYIQTFRHGTFVGMSNSQSNSAGQQGQIYKPNRQEIGPAYVKGDISTSLYIQLSTGGSSYTNNNTLYTIFPVSDDKDIIFGRRSIGGQYRYVEFSTELGKFSKIFDMQEQNLYRFIHGDVAYGYLCAYDYSINPYTMNDFLSLSSSTLVDETTAAANYSRPYVYLANISVEDDIIGLAPVHIRRQEVPYYRRTAQTRINNKVVYNISNHAIALIDCYTDKDIEAEDFRNSERPAIVILKVAPPETQEP